MKRNRVTAQADLFNNVPAPPAFTNSHPRHDELVELLAKLLREVVQIPSAGAPSSLVTSAGTLRFGISTGVAALSCLLVADKFCRYALSCRAGHCLPAARSDTSQV